MHTCKHSLKPQRVCSAETIIKGNDCRNLYVFVLHDIQNLQHLTFCALQYLCISFAIAFVVRVCWLLLRWLCSLSAFRLFLFPSLVCLRGSDCERERTARNCKADGGWMTTKTTMKITLLMEWMGYAQVEMQITCEIEMWMKAENEFVFSICLYLCWMNELWKKGGRRHVELIKKKNDIFVQKSYWNWFYFISFFRCSVDVTYLLFIDNINIIIIINIIMSNNNCIVGVRQRVEAILSFRSLK